MSPKKSKVPAKSSNKQTTRSSIEPIFEKAIAGSPSGIVITDLKGDVVYVNQAFIDLIGYTGKREVVGQNAMEMVFHEGLGTQILTELQQKGHYSGEYSRYRSDGALIDVHILASLITDEKGNPSHLMAIISDVTKIKETEAEYRSLFESVPVGVFRTKPGVGEIIDVNGGLIMD